MFNNFCDREVVIISTKQTESITSPQDLIIEGLISDGTAFKIDIGRICYLIREDDCGNLRHKTKHYTTGLVKISSLSVERVGWLSAYLDEILQKGWRDETVRGKLHDVRSFLNFCDFQGSKPITLDDLVSNYKYYQTKLYQRSRLSSKKSLSARTIYTKLITARNFVKIAFGLSEIELLNIIPVHRHTPSNNTERTSSLEDFRIYIQTCITYFDEFSNAILNKIYPIPITLPNSKSEGYYWDCTYNSGIKKLSNCFNSKQELLPYDDIKPILSTYYEGESNQRAFYQNTLIKNRNQWIDEKLDSRKVYAYNLCVHCFYYIYLSFTAANIQPTLDLKIYDLDIEKLGLSTFAKKHKYRAGRKVEFTTPPQLKRFLIKFLRLREWVESLGLNKNCREYLFVRIGEHRQLKRFARNSTSYTIKDSALFKNVKKIPARDIRNLCAEYYIKHSKGNLSVVAKKLNNSLATVAKFYTTIDIESQSIEMNQYHEEISTVILTSNRTNGQSIPVKTSVEYNSEKIPTGSCSNLSDQTPIKHEGFNQEAPTPSCATFESCLFCEFFTVHIDFEDIHKLLSLKEALLKSSELRNDPEHQLTTIEPCLYRIDEIIRFIQQQDTNAIDLVNDAIQSIDVQIYNEYWSEHISFLTLASQQKDKAVSL
ncbi:hypothetical protein [Psychrobacter sp.]|uniref:hypothetical protein n=1 Tax=Psychrobacter sp. TaxID=56811 RepID=UPI0025D44B6F|nr:hypothetical protein [Psychrobacter sp.]